MGMSKKKYKGILTTLDKAGVVKLSAFIKLRDAPESDIEGVLVDLYILDLLKDYTKGVNYELEKLARYFLGIAPEQMIDVNVTMWRSVDSKSALQNIGSYKEGDTVNREMNSARSLIFAKKVLKPTLKTLADFLKVEKEKVQLKSTIR